MTRSAAHRRRGGVHRWRSPCHALACVAVACLALAATTATAAAAARPDTRGNTTVHAQTTPVDVPAAPGPLLWSDPLPVDLLPLNAISCPSTVLCVAIDRAGGILWSVHPTGPAGDWHLNDVDQGNQLTGISCPTTTLCVAVDADGDVVSSVDPTGGAAAWSVALIDHNAAALNTDSATPTLTRAISCPSSTLCVAVDAVGDAFVSTDPTGGAGAWTSTYIDPGRTRGCATGGLACQAPLVSVSCPSTTLCAAVDFSGDILTTSTPTATTSWTLTATDTRVGTLWGVSCPTAGFCVAPDGSGRTILTFDPLTPAAINAHAVSAAVYGISCPTVALCLGEADSRNGTSGLLGTTEPAARVPRWAFGPPGAVTGVACASASICIAVDGEGNVSTGVPESTIAQELAVDLLPARHPTRQALAAAGSQTVRFASPFAAQVQLTWTSVPSGAAAPATLATADHRFARPGSATFRLQLTAAGRRALRGRSTLTVAEVATFATDVGSLTRTRQVTFAATPTPHHRHKRK